VHGNICATRDISDYIYKKPFFFLVNNAV
jgi:hypothetical protein